jgi:hypothetical protein
LYLYRFPARPKGTAIEFSGRARALLAPPTLSDLRFSRRGNRKDKSFYQSTMDEAIGVTRAAAVTHVLFVLMGAAVTSIASTVPLVVLAHALLRLRHGVPLSDVVDAVVARVSASGTRGRLPAAQRTAALMCVAAWLGALLSPLDWEVWWVDYPVPSLIFTGVVGLVL